MTVLWVLEVRMLSFHYSYDLCTGKGIRTVHCNAVCYHYDLQKCCEAFTSPAVIIVHKSSTLFKSTLYTAKHRPNFPVIWKCLREERTKKWTILEWDFFFEGCFTLALSYLLVCIIKFVKLYTLSVPNKRVIRFFFVLSPFLVCLLCYTFSVVLPRALMIFFF